MIRRRKGFGLLFLAIALVLGLTTVVQDSPAHAQVGHNGRVTLTTTQTEVYEGAAVIIALTRSGGPIDQPVPVRVESSENNRIISFGNNPSNQIHNVTIEPGQNTATLTFTAYVDGVSEPGFDPLAVNITTVGNGYQRGNPWEATVEINDPPGTIPIIEISSSSTTVQEGSFVPFTLRRSGDLSSPLTVNLRYDDPHGLLRGDHWDPPPNYRTEFTFKPGEEITANSFSVPDDQRHVDGNSFTLTVVPSDDYLLGNEGLSTEATWEVSDNDTAQELELNFGKNGANDADANEGDTLAFVVKRRQQDADAGQDARLVVRVETDRTGSDPLLEDWTEDSVTGRFFRDYALELTGSDTEVRHEIEVVENGVREGDWNYWASIRKLEDVEGNPITDAQEAEYWTVKSGFRETTIEVGDSRNLTGRVYLSTTQTEVYEGAEAHYTLTRSGGPISRANTVELRAIDYNDDPDNYTEELQLITVDFRPWESTATVGILAPVDELEEEDDDNILTVNIRIAGSGYRIGSTAYVSVDINDPPDNLPIVDIAFNAESVDEGGNAVFTLTRSGDTSSEVTVDLRFEDEYEMLRGNHWEPPPTLPAAVTIPAGVTTHEVTVPVPDDQRDVPEESPTLLLELLPSDDYLIGGPGLGEATDAEITVTDNDTAQELELNFGKNGANDADANEGDTLAFVVKRRQQDADAGQNARFVVRVETNRTGRDPLLEDWTEDSVTGRFFRDYPLELTGNDTEVRQEIHAIENGIQEGDWSYWASIRTLEDVDGNPITDAQEAEYWTVKSGFRETTIDVTDSGNATGSVYLSTTQTEVYEGAVALFTLTRSGGPIGRDNTVQLLVRDYTSSVFEPVNEFWFIDVTFQPWESTATVSILAPVDDQEETVGSNTLEVNIRAAGRGYRIGNTNIVAVDVNDQPDSIPNVDIAFNSESVNEGGNAVFTLTRSGDTSSEVTVDLSLEDSNEMLRGNHWEPPPQLPTSVTIPAGVTTHEVNVPVPDDQRAVPGGSGEFKLKILPSDDYLIGGLGEGTEASTTIVDNDTPQVLQLDWGWLDHRSQYSGWEPGESYSTCAGASPLTTGVCTPGTAEGIFYYEDDRNFAFVNGVLEEPFPAHFRVTRRAEDVGQTATFVVRVEHNRGWRNPRHAHWPTDTVTGNPYFEIPLELTGNQRQVVGRIEILDNGFLDSTEWEYSAEIRRLEDIEKGTSLTADQEAEYWTVRESISQPRINVATVSRRGPSQLNLQFPSPDSVAEGQEVTFTLERHRGFPFEPFEVQVRTWEPNRIAPDGSNPSEILHTLTFPAMAMTPQFVLDINQTLSFTVTTTDDADYEAQDYLVAEIVPGEGRWTVSNDRAAAQIVDDDVAGVTVRPTAITAVSGSANEYSLVLETRPFGDVTVTIDGAASTDLLVDSSSLTFTRSNWNIPQKIGVTAVQNAVQGMVTLTHTVSSADDAQYDAETAEDVAVTIIEARDHPMVLLGATEADHGLTVDEGGSETYSIVLSSQPAGDVTVDIGGVPGTDLSLDTTTLTFTATDWNVPQTVTVTDGQDTDVVNDTITLTHNVSSVDDENYHGLNAGNVVVTVTDDDVPELAVNFEQATYTVTEGGSETIRVTLSGDPKRAVDVPITAANQGNTSDSDYSGVPSFLTFNSGQTTQTFTFTAVQDAVDDDDESVKLAFGETLPDGMFAGNTRESVVSITDDDGPPVTVSFEHEYYTVLEGNSVTVTVALDIDPEREVVVPLTVSEWGGTTSADYSGVPQSVTFNSGETEKRFTLNAAQDTANESGNYVTVRIGSTLPDDVSLGAPDRANVAISDERTTHIDRVEFNGVPTEDTTVSGLFFVRVWFNPSATELQLEDLEITGGTAQDILYRPRDSTNVWYVYIMADEPGPSLGGDDEEEATVTVRVPQDVVEGGNPAAEVTYNVVPSFTAELTTNAPEPVTRNFWVTITFDEDVTGLPSAVEGGAWYFSPSEDVMITNGAYVEHRRNSARNWQINVSPDVDAETVTITLPYGRVATGSHTGIWNQEASLGVRAGVRTVEFERSGYRVNEGDGVTVTVTLGADPLATVEIPLSVVELGNAEAGDHSGIPPSLTFNSGETEKTFTFLATDDLIDDDGERVRIDIGSPLPNGFEVGSAGQTTVSITDNDTSGVKISETSLEIEEGTFSSYTVVLSSEPAGDVTVAMEGIAGTDLSLDKSSLTFTALDWKIPQTVTVTAEHDDDAVAEPVATITHTSSSIVDTIYNGLGVDDVVVTVSEDDTVGITVTHLRRYIREGEGLVAAVTIVLDSQPTADVTIHAQRPMHFTSEDWHVPREGFLSFAHDTDTLDRVWNVAFSSAEGGDYDGIPVPVLRVTEVDDDPVMRYTLSEIEPVEEDAGTVRVTVKAVTNEDGVPTQDYKVTLAALEDTAESGIDFDGGEEILVFAEEDFEEFVNDDGDTRYRQTVYFDVPIFDDMVAEEPESFRVRLWSAAGHQWPAYDIRERRVTITEDDTKPKVTLVLSHATINESGNGNVSTVTATLSAASSEDTTVTVEVDPTDTTTLSNNTTLTIDAGATSSAGTVTVTAVDDTVYSGNRQVAVQGEAVNTAGVDDPDEVTLTITEDDTKPKVTLVLSHATINESGNGNVSTVTATLSAASSEDTTVTVEVDPTDTTTLSNNTTLTIDAGATSSAGTVTVTAVDDTVYSGNRQVAVQGEAVNTAGVDDPDEVTLTITEDDTKPKVTLVLSHATINESGNGNVSTVTATLSAASSEDTTVTVEVDPTDTTTLSNNTTLTIDAGATSSAGTVTVTAVDDTVYSGNRQVAVQGEAVNTAGVDDPDEVTLTITEDDTKPKVTLVLSHATINESGNGNVSTVTATLSAASSEDTTVTVEVDPTDTTTLSNNTTLTIDAGATSSAGTVTVTAVDDTVYSGNRQVAVQGEAVNTAGVDDPDEVTLTITEDDTKPKVTLVLSHATINESGNGNVSTVTATLSAASSEDTTVTVEVDPTDTTTLSNNTTLTIDAGATSSAGTVTVTAVDDTVYSGNRQVAVQGEAVNTAGVDDPDEVTLTITEDDTKPKVTLVLSHATINESGNGNVSTVTATLSAASSEDTTVTVEVDPTDTTTLSNNTTLTIDAGATSSAGTVTVTAVDDTVYSGNRQVAVQGEAVNTAGVDDPDEVTLTITEDDTKPKVTLVLSHATINESGNGNVSTVTATLSAASSEDTTVTVEVDPTDTTTLSNNTTLTIDAGATSSAGTVTVTAVDDTVYSGNRQVAVQGEAVNTAGVDDPDEVTLTITEDDTKPKVTLVLSHATINESGNGNVSTVTATLSAASSEDTTVTVEVDPTDTTTLSNNTTLTIDAGATSSAGTVTVTAVDDTVYSGNRQVAVQGEAVNTAGVDDPDEVTLTITEDDTKPKVTLVLSHATINESGNGNVSTVTATLSAASSEDTTVTVEVDPTDTTTLSNNTTLTIDAGATSSAGTVTVTAVDDTVYSGNRQVAVQGEAVNTAGVDDPDEVTLTITEDDTKPKVTLVLSHATINESGNGNVSTVTATLSAASSEDTTVTVEVDPTDTTTLSNNTTLTIDAGATSSAGTVTVTAVDDTVYSGNRQVAVQGEAVNTAGVDDPDEVTLTITEDDTNDDVADITVSYETSTYELREGSTTEITVVLSDGLESPLTIGLRTSNHSGTTVDDYSEIPLNVTFAIGEMKKLVTFVAIQDVDDESAEYVTLGFDTLPPGIEVGTPAETTVTILDSHRVFFSATEYEAYEGGTGDSVAVYIDSPVTQETIIPITATGMNGATRDDWTGVPDEMFFAPGQRNGYFTAMAYDDDVEDDGEMVLLEFGDLPPGVVAGTPSTATVELMNRENGVTPECDNRANKIIVLDRVGSIDAQGETDFYTIALDPHRFYILEVIGQNDGRDILDEVTYLGTLTLENPDVIQAWNSDRSSKLAIFTEVIDDFGGGTDSLMILASTEPRPIQIEVGSSDGGTGRYQVKIRVSNLCHVPNGEVEYLYAGGPDGYPLKFDEPADTSTEDEVRTAPYYEEPKGSGGFLGNHGEEDPDVDWFWVDLHSDYHYMVEVWASTRYLEQHQATELKILGIYDESGIAIEGTSSSTSGMNVSVEFRPKTTGRHHISVGSDGDDHTGVYEIRVTGVLIGEEEPEWTPPPAPRNLRAIANEDGSVSLTWDAPDDDSVQSYQILRHRPNKGENTPMIRLEDTVSLDTTYTDLYVTPGVLHVYYVKALNRAGISERSNKAEVTPLANSYASGTPATEAPTILGTARVGETLTADTSGIADDDGLENAAYSYQWVANDGTSDADIPGATASTYTLVADDEGKTIKVRVSFTDDADNDETLTSGATDAVAASEPPAKPAGLSVVVSRNMVTITWDDPQDDSITGYVILRRDRAIHPIGTFVTIAGDTGSADTIYTDDTVEPDKKYVYRIKAINEHGKVSERSPWISANTPAG